jgi:hypothetical protein
MWRAPASSLANRWNASAGMAAALLLALLVLLIMMIIQLLFCC